MLVAMFAITLLLLVNLVFVFSSDTLLIRQTCNKDYNLCSPVGATNSELPVVGPGLSSLYSDLVQAIDSGSIKEALSIDHGNLRVKKQADNPLCCAETTQCLLLPSYNIAFCWDRFTTNYFFPDGSSGSIVTGNYTSVSGTNVDLVYGNWESQDGTKGNIYSNTPTMKPNTATLPMPQPWTSSGIGSAIPVSVLGSSAITTDITTESTISAITLPSTTISIGTSVCGHCNLTIIPGLTSLPPAGTIVTNATGFPVTTVTRNDTDVPSASSNINMSSIVIPPFTNSYACTFTISSIVLVMAFNIVMCILVA